MRQQAALAARLAQPGEAASADLQRRRRDLDAALDAMDFDALLAPAARSPARRRSMRRACARSPTPPARWCSSSP
jgi:hypothetical protein